MAGGGHLELELGAWLDTSLLLLEITVLRTAARDTWGRGQAQGTALSALELGQASGCFPPELTPIVSQNMEPAPQGVGCSWSLFPGCNRSVPGLVGWVSWVTMALGTATFATASQF